MSLASEPAHNCGHERDFSGLGDPWTWIDGYGEEEASEAGAGSQSVRAAGNFRDTRQRRDRLALRCWNLARKATAMMRAVGHYQK
jgi:hypothetical protein